MSIQPISKSNLPSLNLTDTMEDLGGQLLALEAFSKPGGWAEFLEKTYFKECHEKLIEIARQYGNTVQSTPIWTPIVNAFNQDKVSILGILRSKNKLGDADYFNIILILYSRP